MNSLEKQIPKQVFQTWGSNLLPPSIQQASQSWQQLNPDWQQHLYTDEMCHAMIAEHFPAEVLWAYEQLIPGAFKADLWRYCVLYIYGGVYADIKLTALLPLNQIIHCDAYFATVIDISTPAVLDIPAQENPYLMQGFLASVPKHPILWQAIQTIVKHVKEGAATSDYLSMTGPGLLGRVVNRFMGREDLTSYTAGVFDGMQFLPVWDRKHNVFLNLQGQSCIDRKCPQYRHAQRHRSPVVHDYDVIKGQYARCWYLGLVYKNGQMHYSIMNAKQQRIFAQGKQRATLVMVKLLMATGAKQFAQQWSSRYIQQYGRSLTFYWYKILAKFSFWLKK